MSTDRFRLEIEVAASLQHPHIVPLLAAGQAGGHLYYTMPFVAGDSLRARLTREGELLVTAAVCILADIARALAYAHRHGIVHRDIKPENVLLAEGEAQVADFGIAKALSASSEGGALSSAGLALGTHLSADICAHGTDARVLTTGFLPAKTLLRLTPHRSRCPPTRSGSRSP